MIEVTHICQADACYPHRLLDYLGDDAPATLSTVGNLELLNTEPLALFCSMKCPGALILQTYDYAQQLRESGRPVIGGFHSPVEAEALNILLRGKNPILICLARSLEQKRFSSDVKDQLANGRLLLLSPFAERERRPTRQMAIVRNLVVAAFAKEVAVVHAEPGSKTETLCEEVVGWGKALFTFDSELNANLIKIGARQFGLSETY